MLLFRRTAAADMVEHGHAHRHTVFHLLQDHRVGAIRHVGADLHAAVHGAGMHHQDARLGQLHHVPGEAEEAGIFAHGGQERLALPFQLDAEHHDHVGVFHRVPHPVADRDVAQPLDAGRDERGWSGEKDPGAHLGQAVDVGAGHPAVGDVADDGHLEPLQGSQLLPYGHHVQEALGGVLVGAVAGIDDRVGYAFGQVVVGARDGVAHDDDVRLHGLDIAGRVRQGLALLHGAGGGRDVEGVGREPLGCDLEGGPGACGRLEEQVYHRLAAQGRDLLDLALADLLHVVGGVKEQFDLLRRQVLQPQDVFVLENHVRPSESDKSKQLPLNAQ